jgi:hypothetical protein
MDDGFLICAGVFALLAVVAALPLSIIALTLALRAGVPGGVPSSGTPDCVGAK